MLWETESMSWFHLILYLGSYISTSLLDFEILEERDHDFQPESFPICSQEMVYWEKYKENKEKAVYKNQL